MPGAGTKEDPWKLKTAPGSSEYTMFRDESAEPPTLVCQVGSTTLKYQLRAIEDLHAMLLEYGDWMPLGQRTRRRKQRREQSKRGAGQPITRSRDGTACARATEVVSGCTCLRCSRNLDWSSWSTTPATTEYVRSSNGVSPDPV